MEQAPWNIQPKDGSAISAEDLARVYGEIMRLQGMSSTHPIVLDISHWGYHFRLADDGYTGPKTVVVGFSQALCRFFMEEWYFENGRLIRTVAINGSGSGSVGSGS